MVCWSAEVGVKRSFLPIPTKRLQHLVLQRDGVNQVVLRNMLLIRRYEGTERLRDRDGLLVMMHFFISKLIA